MSGRVKLEICCNSVESAIIAEECGADRVEFCINLADGGTTPSHNDIKSIKQKLSIPVNVLVRPRAGDFVYTADEINQTIRDIEFCKAHGIDGVVIGCLTLSNEIDTEQLASLIDAARPMSVTFHRAFDECNNQVHALDILIDCGVDRVLTTGGAVTAFEGVDNLSSLITHAHNKIIVMPGGGIRSNTIENIIDTTGAREVHSAAGVLTDLFVFRSEISKMEHIINELLTL